MVDFLIAQSDLDEWIRILIIALVFGGSALGAVGKKLIEIFSPKEDPPPAKKIDPVSAPKRPVRRAPMDVEVLPLPQQTSSPPSAAPPVVLPPVARPAPAQARRPQRSKARPVPPPQPAPSRHQRKPEPKKREAGNLRHLEPTVDDDLNRLGSRVAQRAGKVDTRVDDHLGHLTPHVAEGRSASPKVTTRSSIGKLAGLSRGEIRRAILLREILGPPVALRSQEDRI